VAVVALVTPKEFHYKGNFYMKNILAGAIALLAVLSCTKAYAVDTASLLTGTYTQTGAGSVWSSCLVSNFNSIQVQTRHLML
jgi:hypothetical protein